MTGLRVSRLDPKGLCQLRDALAAVALPTADLTEPGRFFFAFADAAGLVGFGGIEGGGLDRLLRSLIVVADRRRNGIGGAMLALLEREAMQQSTVRLHLLTTTAAAFFRSWGYADADRALAPPSIASSAEFIALCPASASYLTKALT